MGDTQRTNEQQTTPERSQEITAADLDAAVAKAVEAEREANGIVCDQLAGTALAAHQNHPDDGHLMAYGAASQCADLIRARGKR